MKPPASLRFNFFIKPISSTPISATLGFLSRRFLTGDVTLTGAPCQAVQAEATRTLASGVPSGVGWCNVGIQDRWPFRTQHQRFTAIAMKSDQLLLTLIFAAHVRVFMAPSRNL